MVQINRSEVSNRYATLLALVLTLPSLSPSFQLLSSSQLSALEVKLQQEKEDRPKNTFTTSKPTPTSKFPEENETPDSEPEHENLLPGRATSSIMYTFNEQHMLAQQLYGSSASINYEQLSYGPSTGNSARFGLDDEYWVTTTPTNDTEAECLETSEAQQTLVQIQYATVSGARWDVNSEQRRRFDMWAKINPALFKLFESLESVTREVDYRPLA